MRAVRTFLEMTDPAALDGAAAPSADAQVGLVRDCPPSFWRRLYAEVGGQYHWVDRLPWTDEEIRAYLSDPALELWLLRVGGETAGYFELRGGADDAFEIVYFGLLPAFVGKGLGKFFLTCAVERAWARGAKRVWLHTSSLDHGSALPNYLARGFSVFKQETYDV